MFRYIYQKMPSIINMKYSLYMMKGGKVFVLMKMGYGLKES